VAIERQITAKVSRAIMGNPVTGGVIVIEERDLDINSAGISPHASGATIYGMQTEITPDGIEIGSPKARHDQQYSAQPVIANGRVELKDDDRSWIDPFYGSSDRRGVINGLENGVNQALDSKGLRPVSLSLSDGSLSIQTEPA
jgi:hypothetical protein